MMHSETTLAPLSETDFDAAVLQETQALQTAEQLEHYYGDAATAMEVGFFLEVAQLHPHARVLDLFCGPGRHVRAMRSLGVDAVGLDLQFRGPGVVCGDVLHSPFATGSFDAVVAFNSSPFEVWRSASTVNAYLRSIARMLRPGGRFIFGWQTDRFTAPRAVALWRDRLGARADDYPFVCWQVPAIDVQLRRTGFTRHASYANVDPRSITTSNTATLHVCQFHRAPPL